MIAKEKRVKDKKDGYDVTGLEDKNCVTAVKEVLSESGIDTPSGKDDEDADLANPDAFGRQLDADGGWEKNRDGGDRDGCNNDNTGNNGNTGNNANGDNNSGDRE